MAAQMRKLFFIAVAAAALTTPAFAQDRGEAAPQSGLRGNWLQADTTRQQAQQRADLSFQRLDLNKDGTLTHEEAQQAAAQFMARRGGGDASRITARIERMFAGAQTITLQQYEQVALARFDGQDLNHDGVVTSAERQQGRDARQ
jgi:hypothetical protein